MNLIKKVFPVSREIFWKSDVSFVTAARLDYCSYQIEAELVESFHKRNKVKRFTWKLQKQENFHQHFRLGVGGELNIMKNYKYMQPLSRDDWVCKYGILADENCN